MKRAAFLSLMVLALLPFGIKAQECTEIKENLVNPQFYTRETVSQRLPVPYVPIREADVMWSKQIWRIIDLRQKANHALYFPTTCMQDRVSLIQRLVRGVKYNEITAYDPFGGDDNAFTARLSYEQVIRNFGAEDYTQTIEMEDGSLVDTVISGEIKWQDVKQLLIREEWFFDKQHSTFKVRVIGICPIMFKLSATGELAPVKLFWVYYPEARSILANTDVFNARNDAQRQSFDDIFFKRKFDSYIMRESNVYDNRLINEYTFGGIQVQQESDRIKLEMFNFEHDLWEY